MRFPWVTSVLLASSYALPLPARDDCLDSPGLQLIDSDIESQRYTFQVGCKDCFPQASTSAETQADEALVFELAPATCSASTADDCFDIVLNDHRVRENLHNTISIDVSTPSGESHNVDVLIDFIDFNLLGLPTSLHTHFRILKVDGHAPTEPVEFSASWTSSSDSLVVAKLQRITRIVPDSATPFSSCPALLIEATSTDEMVFAKIDDYDDHLNESTTELDIAIEVQALRLLEEDAQVLQAEIGAKKKAIRLKLAEYHSHTSLTQLIHQCDGIICSAKAIANRFCEKIDLAVHGQPGFLKIQAPIQNNENASSYAVGETKDGARPDSSHTFSGDSTSQPDIQKYIPQDPFLKAVSFVATLLGLTALFAFLRRKCMSMRKRVERAADLEERRNARAYRRAARRALMRKRWDNLVSAVSCFRSREEPRNTDYEEKRALILQDALQDALLEQDPDQAEKGQIMEAEIRELRRAQEIVANIIQRDNNRFNVPTPVKDPPPSLIPLPYALAARSRASTGTLPSYNSESLPDYSSTPEQTGSSSIVADGFENYTPTSLDDQHYTINQGRPSASSYRTHPSPISSVIGISPRVSAETLRTRFSKSTNYT